MAAVSIKVSAPGKAILFGEHAVVYGKLAIATSIDLRTTITLEENEFGNLHIVFSNLNIEHSFEIETIKNAMKKFNFPLDEQKLFSIETPELLDVRKFAESMAESLEIDKRIPCYRKQYNCLVAVLSLYYGIIYSSLKDVKSMTITINSQLSVGSGTGSSASLMVSLAGTFIHYVHLKTNLGSEKNTFNDEELALISKWAFEGEKLFHCNPSGIDNTVCTYGSIVSYRKGEVPLLIKNCKNLKAILVNTKMEKNTAEMVNVVKRLKDKWPNIFESIFTAIDELVHDALAVLNKLFQLEQDNVSAIEECFQSLESLVSINHRLLCALNVSNLKLDHVVQIASSNSLAAKITGAGGGGNVIILMSPFKNSLEIQRFNKSMTNYDCYSKVVDIGGNGVQIEPFS